jgi:predicted nucleotidyltransferase
MRPTRRDEILDLIKEHRDEITRFGAKSLSIFGSVARDQVRDESDIDILVQFASPPTFIAYMDLKFFLEDLLGREVDLVPNGRLKPRIRPAVEREAILVT